MLDLEAKNLLTAVAAANRPAFETIGAAAARKLYKETRAAVSPAPPDVAVAQDLSASGPNGPIPVRYYRPVRSTEAQVLPLLVFYHGGGWVIGDLDTHDVVCRTLCNHSGAAVLSVDYRMGPEHKFPAAVEDAYAALLWAKAEAEAGRLAVDGARLAVGGDSAGGNLAAVACLLARQAGGPAIAFQLLIYPATDMVMTTRSHAEFGEGHLLTRSTMAWFQQQYLRNDADQQDWRASPLRAADLSGLPPAFVLVAGHDPLRDEGEAYAKALERAGNAVVFREFPGQIHGFITMGKVLPQANMALAEMGEALKQAFE